MWIRCLAVAAASVVSASCGGAARDGDNLPGVRQSDQRYVTTGLVLESREHGPELCFGATDSNPPQCSGVPLASWDWSAVGGEERVRGTVWGAYEVVGTFDGSSFAVLEARPAQVPAAPTGLDADADTTPCPDPPRGWRPVDATRLTEKHFGDALDLARSSADYAGDWIDYIGTPPYEEPVVKDHIILNVAFTGDLGAHGRELREKWGGALCLIEHERTERELARLQDELTSGVPEELGLWWFGASLSVQENAVAITVLLSDEQAQELLDARYGEGAVRVFSLLRPVE